MSCTDGVSSATGLTNTLLLIFTGVIAIATALALFQDWVRSLIWHPELDLIIEPKPPDSHKTSAYYPDIRTPSTMYEAPCYFYRLRILNLGRAAARDVEVYAAGVDRKTSTGDWLAVERFIPQHLAWSLLRGERYLPYLPPKATRSCDLGCVIEPKYRRSFHETEHDEQVPDTETIFSCAFEVKALRRGHLLRKGEYRISLEVAASNAAPKTFQVVVNNPGMWYDDETTMLRDGVAVRLA